ELFDEANRALAELDGEAPVATTVLTLELAALKLLGHLPSLDECVGCGTAMAGEGRVAFGLIAGGVLCGRCRSGQRSVVSVTAAALEGMRRLAEEGSGFRVQGSEESDRKVLGEIRGLMNNYLAHHLGHKLRMHSYLGRAV
ncbi:MAG: DNA repair protein RecO C-terminal domain-containing protein, partial [Pirellulaceae bacterium]